MDIVVDLTPIYAFFSMPPDILLMRFLVLFGWIPIGFVFLWGAKEIWLDYISDKWGATVTFTFLAIDIPRGNEQTPRAVENILTYLAGAHSTFNLIEQYWVGKFQLSFSLEIVSIEGYTQFLIRTPTHFRNLVESAIYSQYPDAEITEVNDYTSDMPTRFPDDEYDIWGAEFVYAKNDAYPLKTYESFFFQDEEKELRFKDPMASLMDLCSNLGKGEQLWYQILVKPIGFDWMDEKQKEVSKLLKETPSAKPNLADKLADTFIGWLQSFSEMIISIWSEVPEKKEEKKEEDALKMMNLKPNEKKKVESIQRKVSKLGFDAKNRFIYIARKDVMNKPKVVNGFVGYMKQFVDMDLNNLKPDMEKTATIATYFFKDSRINYKKTRLMAAYKGRSTTKGRKLATFNIEELATLWHFPVESYVRAPLIQKAPGRKAVPPMSLPRGEETPEAAPDAEREQEEAEIFGGASKAPGKELSQTLPTEGVSEAPPAEEGMPWEQEPPKPENEEIAASEPEPAEALEGGGADNAEEVAPASPSQGFSPEKPKKKGSPPQNLPTG